MSAAEYSERSSGLASNLASCLENSIFDPLRGMNAGLRCRGEVKIYKEGRQTKTETRGFAQQQTIECRI